MQQVRILISWGKRSMLLSSVKEGLTVTIKDILLKQPLASKLFSLGIVPKATVKILKNDLHYPLIVLIGNSRLVMERNIASKIEVE